MAESILEPIMVLIKQEDVIASDKAAVIEISDTEDKPKVKKKRIKKKPGPDSFVKCIVCDKMCSSKYQLKRHMRTHTGSKPYMCNECGNRYSQACHLKTHQLRHTGVKKHVCQECNASFLLRSVLVRHQKIHSGERPFVCDFCPKSFIHKRNLVMHIKAHTGDRQFPCEKCGKRFMTLCKMKAHAHRVHDEMKEGKRRVAKEKRLSEKGKCNMVWEFND